MSTGFTQQERLISVETDLGPNVLLLTAFRGREEMSRLFTYTLEMLSEKKDVAPKDIVGKKITFSVKSSAGKVRYFNGMVSRFTVGLNLGEFQSYRAEVVPWLWFLTQTTDCRIFQNKTALDIIEEIFKDLKMTDFDKSKAKGPFAKREYCVQYRETDFNFVSRLMEEEGVFYFFRHEKSKHTLVLADQKTAYDDCVEKNVDYRPGAHTEDHVRSWEHHFEFFTGEWAQTDYNFETPTTDLKTTSKTIVDLPDTKKYEKYDYPGLYTVKADGTRLTDVRMGEAEAPHNVAHGTSGCTTFTPGAKFTFKSHDSAIEKNKTFVIQSIEHQASDSSYSSDPDEQTEYSNSFICLPDTVTFRPARITPKPVVQGPQTAVVVGPAGEEIYTDKYGRIVVQFPWDRKGKKDEKSSCFIRVAQNWAGDKWGIIFNPRIGQEVIVDFLEGDPDRPIVTGRVYNADKMPPYDLPANQTQSTIKTRSSLKGDAQTFNELRFEDKIESEEIYFHAEKDFNRVVENNDTIKIGFDKMDKGDQTIEVFNNRILKVGTSESADGSQTIEIWKDRTATIKKGNESITIDEGDHALNITKGMSVTEAKNSIELIVGSSSIKIEPDKITLSSGTISIEGTSKVEAKGPAIDVVADSNLVLMGGKVAIN